MSVKGDIGVIGLAVMGQNLILNMNDHGFKVVAYNRTTSKVDEFLQSAAKGTNIIGAYSLEDLASKLEKPRKVMLMVRAGDVVDQFIEALLPHLEEGDIIKINIPEMTLNVDVSDEELATRRAKWQPREPKVTTGYLARYASLVTSANTGAILKTN